MLRIHSLLCLLALVSGIVFAGCSSSGPARTVERFFRAVESGEVKAASAMVSESTVEMMGRKKIEAGLQRETEAIAQKKGIQSIEILSEEINGQAAEVRIRLSYGNGETDEQTVNLSRTSGRWLLTPKGK